MAAEQPLEIRIAILGNQVYTNYEAKQAMSLIDHKAAFVAYRDTLKKGAVVTCVKDLRYHEPLGQGDAHFVDAVEKDGSVMRIFAPDFIYFTKASVIARV